MRIEKANKLLKAYNKAVESNDDFAITIIYTRIKNLGFILVMPIKQ